MRKSGIPKKKLKMIVNAPPLKVMAHITAGIPEVAASSRLRLDWNKSFAVRINSDLRAIVEPSNGLSGSLRGYCKGTQRKHQILQACQNVWPESRRAREAPHPRANGPPLWPRI